MSMVINTNTASFVAQAAQAKTSSAMDISMERLSTGKRINTAADDAAGIAIATRLTAEIQGINQAVRNAADGQAMIDTAEGAHDEISNILQRMRELAVQSANDTNNDTDRGYLQAEVNALVTEIDRIANVTTWAGKGLIDSQHTYSFQVGSKGASDNQIAVTMNAMTGAALGVKEGNATVGAQGATLKEVGENVLQVGGTPVVGDVYEFKINGESVSVKLTEDAGNAANFDYEVSVNGGAYAAVVASTFDQGKTAAGVADILAQAINALSGHAGMTATAAGDDGAVTITQGNILTGGSDVDGSGTATNALVDWAATTASRGATTNATTGATGETWAAGSAYEITITSTTGTNVDAESFSVVVNGQTIVAETTIAQVATAGYTKDALGVANYLADKLSIATNAKGFSFEVGHDATNAATSVMLKVTNDSTALISDEAATPKASTSALLINTASDANAAIATIDTALDTVNSQRAQLGAVSNRLKSTVSNLTNISVNLEAGRSRIQDADFATETSNLTKTQILSQAATAMLAQANASKQSVLSLLQG